MIQRSQTLWLLLAVAALVVFVTQSEAWTGGALAAVAWLPTAGFALAVLTAVVAAVAVFLYKDRKRQRQVILAAQWLDVALVLALAAAVGLVAFGSVEAAEPLLPAQAVLLVLPVGAYVFLRLARRGVDKDIKLVKSMDRLR